MATKTKTPTATRGLLKTRGAYVLIGSALPRAVILAESAYRLFVDRIGVVGFDKATAYTFGHTVTNALPCTAACMEFMALNYQGAHQEEVRGICARIALGQPIGGDEGGTHARVDAPKPRPSAPSGATFPVIGNVEAAQS